MRIKVTENRSVVTDATLHHAVKLAIEQHWPQTLPRIVDIRASFARRGRSEEPQLKAGACLDRQGGFVLMNVDIRIPSAMKRDTIADDLAEVLSMSMLDASDLSPIAAAKQMLDHPAKWASEIGVAFKAPSRAELSNKRLAHTAAMLEYWQQKQRKAEGRVAHWKKKHARLIKASGAVLAESVRKGEVKIDFEEADRAFD